MNKTTVLIVEDDAIVAVHLRSMLSGLGYRVVGAVATGEAAIDTAVAMSPDLILMDIELAGQIDGVTAAGRIRAVYDVPVIFVTSYSQDPLLQRAKITGPYGYLIKPFAERDLVATIEMALYRHTVDKQLKENMEELQKSKAFTLAILNSVTASIAVLNLEGQIIAVNEPWQRFALTNGSATGKPAVHTEIGSNYLAICREGSSSTIAGDAADATKACAGIKSVLAGRSTDFSFEYPCHSPEEKRWFSMSVTPLGRDKAGVVVSHTNITERKMAEEGLQKAHDELELRVLERTADLASANSSLGMEMVERQQVEVDLQESNRMLQALSFVQSHYISGLSIADLFGLVLADFLLLTDSTIGFIGEILQTPAGEKYIKTFSLSDISWDDESRKIHAKASSGGVEFHNQQSLFGAIMKTGKAVIANQPPVDQRRGGLPAGHPALEAFLGLPIHHNGELTGVVGLANRPGGYDDKLVEYLNPFLIACGNIIDAFRNKQRREVAENHLRESEERYRRITDGLTDYLYRVRFEDGVAVETTHGLACEAVTGYTPEDYVADPSLWMQMVVAEDRQLVTENIQKILEGDNVPSIDHRIIHKDGQIRWVSNRLIPQFDLSGTLLTYDGVVKDITDKRQLIEAREEALNRLEKIASRVPGVVYQYRLRPDGSSCFPFASEAIRDIYRVSPEEVREDAAQVFAILHPDDFDGIGASILKSARDLTPWRHEYRVKFTDGTVNWLFGNALPQLEDDGSVLWHGVITDVSESKLAEDALLKSEEKYRTVADFTYDWETWRSPEGRFLYVSPSCQRITGYAAADFLADPNLFLQITHPEDRNRVFEYYQSVKHQPYDQARQFDFRILTAAGKTRWIGHSSTSVYGNDGQWLGRRESNRDITERVEIQERVYKSNATLNMAIDGLSDPLFLLDAELRIKRLNRAAKDYYGLAGYSEAIGKFCFEAFRGRSSPCVGCATPFSDMYGYSGSFERKGELGHDRLEEVVVDVVRDTAGAPKAAIFRIIDITKQKMIDRQLVQNEKLASLGLLIAGVAHEINNPNNFIYFNIPILRSYLQFLLPIADEYASANSDLLVFNRPYGAFREDCLKLLDNIEHGSTRINQIVGNLREFARDRGKGERRRIDLKLVVEKGLSICLGRIKKLVKTLDVHIPEDLPALVSDPLAIEQIVVNLMVNAAHAADKDDSWVRLTISKDKGQVGEVVVEVSDNGCGMDSKTRKKIFDPFFTTKTAGVGTGLGLSISHRLVTELGGRIEVESEVGKGSTFRLVLATANDG